MGFVHGVLGETTTAASWHPPLEAGAESCSTVLGRKDTGEVSRREGEQHRLQPLWVSSTGTDNWSRSRRGGMQSGGVKSCSIEIKGDAFSGCATSQFRRGGGGAAAFLFGIRQSARHSVL